MAEQCIPAFAKSDPMGDVFSFLGAQDQGRLRSTARLFHEAFDAAVTREIQIGLCGNREQIQKREDFAALDSWFPVSELCCREAPGREVIGKDEQLGTLVVNPRILFNGSVHIPNRFLQSCVAQSIVYFQAEHITSAGDQWMADCSRLSSVNFEGLTALSTVGHYWLYDCSRLTAVDFRGLSALTTVGDDWLYDCGSLTAVSFEGLTALTTVGGFWLCCCPSLTGISFEGLTSLSIVGGYWLNDCNGLTSVSVEGLSALTAVGDSWMNHCRSLTTVSFGGLAALTTVGRHWLGDCPRLTVLNCDGVSAALLQRIPQARVLS